MRLIDADALKDGMMENINPYLGIYESGEPRSFVREDEVLRYIDGFPTIYPVKHGEWLLHEYPDGYYHTECSECGEVYDEMVFFSKKAHYCPNCGSKNGGEE